MEKIPNAVYTKELREEAVKLVKESGLSLPEVGRRLSIPPSTLRYWLTRNKHGTLSEVGKQQKPRSEVEMELLRIKRKLAEVRMERDLLKKQPRTSRRSRSEVRDHKGHAAHVFYYKMCHFFKVSASGYYKWLTNSPSKRSIEEKRLELEIKAAHNRTRQIFGPERLQHDLALHGVNIGICRIRRIRKKLGIRCKQIKKFKITTNSKHSFPVAEDLLHQQFKVTASNQVWVSDLTY